MLLLDDCFDYGRLIIWCRCFAKLQLCPIAVSVIHPLCMSEGTGWVALHYILNPCEGSTKWNGGGKANDWCAVDLQWWLVTLFGDSNGRIGLVPFVV